LKPLSQRLRRLAYVLGGTSLVVLTSWLWLQFGFLNGGVKTQVQQALASALKGRAMIGSVRADWKADLVFEDVSFTVPAGRFEARVKVPKTVLSLRYVDLIFRKKPIEQSLKSIVFDSPKVVWAPSGKAPVETSVTVPSNAPGLEAPPVLPPVDQWILRSGQLSVIRGTDAPLTTVGRMDLSAYRDGDGFALKAVLLPPGRSATGKISVNGRVKAEGPAFECKVRMERWPLASVAPLLQEATGIQPLSGTLTGEVPIRWQVGTPFRFQSRMMIQDGALRWGGAMGAVFSGIQADAGVGTEEIKLLKPASFRLGKTEWVVQGRLPLDGSPVSLTAATNHLFLDSLTQDLRLSPKIEVEGEGKAAFDVSGTLSKPVIHGVADLGPSRLGSWRLESLEMEASFAEGTLRLKRAEGRLYDGILSATGELSPAQGNASPVTLQLALHQIRTQPLAELLGLKDWDGRTDLDVNVGGTLGNPSLLVKNALSVAHANNGKTYRYVFKNELKFSGTNLRLSTKVNDDVRFESQWTDRGEHWELDTLSLRSSSTKVNYLKGKGSWPKKNTDPIDISIEGSQLEIGQTPFLKEQFPGVKGLLSFGVKMAGTRKEPTADLKVDSAALRLGLRKPETFQLSMHWIPRSLLVEKLEWGKSLNAKGTVGLEETAPLDAEIDAHAVPLALLSGLFNVDSEDRDDLEGILTGRVRLLGTRGKPLLDGRAAVTGLKAGGWVLDTLEAEMSVQGERWVLKNLDGTQENGGKVSAKGWLQSGATQSKAQLDWEVRRFKPPTGPRLSGHVRCTGETTSSWFKESVGKMTSPDLVLEGDGSSRMILPSLSADLAWKNDVCDLSLALGEVIHGKARWDAHATPDLFSADLELLPADLSGHPILSQWIPGGWKVEGKVQGSISIPEGTMEHLNISTHLLVAKGRIRGYAFDQLDLSVTGDKKKQSPKLVITQGQTKYELSGTLESPDSFLSPRSTIHLVGPFQNETFPRLLSLLDFNVTGHSVSGDISGDLLVDGTVSTPQIHLNIMGNALQFDRTLVSKAELHVTVSRSGLLLEKSSLSIDKGDASLEEVRLTPLAGDEGAYLVRLKGIARNLPLAALTMNGRLSLDGTVRSNPSDEKDLFLGAFSVTDVDISSPSIFSAKIGIRKDIVSFSPVSGGALVQGQVDFSQREKVVFRAFHAEVDGGALDIDGSVDIRGACNLTSDARNVRIERVGRWISKDFPLTGLGNYHVILQGTLDNPMLNASFSLSAGKLYGLSYDLLDGTLVARDNVLKIGSQPTPFTLSRSGFYAFTLFGTMPFTLSSQGWNRLRNREMDLTASMPKGDLSLFLLAGFAKKAEGPMDFNATVTGTLDHPMVTGDLDFHGGRLVPKMIAASIDDIQGRIKIRSNQVAVEDLNARIGQGRVFIWTPPAEESKMVLDGFVPKYYDLRVRTVTERGVLLNIPAIMRPSEWGEIKFYGTRREDPLLIVGSADEPHVVGTALLDMGHFTFPPGGGQGRIRQRNHLQGIGVRLFPTESRGWTRLLVLQRFQHQLSRDEGEPRQQDHH
jgi:autotransporter translocation and assembly factor TamB